MIKNILLPVRYASNFLTVCAGGFSRFGDCPLQAGRLKPLQL